MVRTDVRVTLGVGPGTVPGVVRGVIQIGTARVATWAIVGLTSSALWSAMRTAVRCVTIGFSQDATRGVLCAVTPDVTRGSTSGLTRKAIDGTLRRAIQGSASAAILPPGSESEVVPLT